MHQIKNWTEEMWIKAYKYPVKKHKMRFPKPLLMTIFSQYYAKITIKQKKMKYNTLK